MHMYLSILLGLVLLVAGGELLVRGAVSSAKALGVSPLLIGLTLVGFGTSTPELVTSVTAAINGSPGIAVGNVVGSNIANILLIIGLAAAISPMIVDKKAYGRDAIMLVLCSLACLAIVLIGEMNSVVGLIFIAMLASYIIFVYKQEKNQTKGSDLDTDQKITAHAFKQVGLSLLLVFVGIGITIFGARYLVEGAIELAKGFGVSDTIVGLTIVAVGTSMPELITSIMAAIRKHSDVAYGNIVGSNIYNILFILGATSLIKPIEIPSQIATLDIWVMLAATVLLVFFARTGFKINRAEGLICFLGYVGYTLYLISIA